MKAIRKILVRFYRTILAVLPRPWVAEMFRLAGEQIGVVSCVSKGNIGFYEARLTDRGVMGYHLIHHTWEPGIQELLFTLAAPGAGSFIDVGANIGLTMIPLGRAYPDMTLIGVEADEENFGYLRRNVDRNGLMGATLHHRAVYSEAGEIEFERSRENAGDHRVRQSRTSGQDRYGESGREVVRVKCDRLDALVDTAALRTPVGMKCDIQGAEVHFFRGAEAILAVTDWLVIEYWPYGIVRAGTRPDEFFELLARHFSYGGIIDAESGQPPTLVPIANLVTNVAEQLRQDGETAHRELLFAKVQQFGKA